MTLRGMDISSWQFQTPSMAGQDFVCIKATQRTTMDPSWPLHYQKAREAGVFVIAYHFGEDYSVSEQVQRFLQVANEADAWVLDRDTKYYSNAMHRWVYPPSEKQCRDFIVSMENAGFPCGLYFNCANYVSVGQAWNWQASPPSICPDIPWDIYQAHSGVPGGDIYKGDSMADLLGVTRVRRLIVDYDEPHNLAVPRGTAVFSLSGSQVRTTSETKPQVGMARGQLGGEGREYWVVALQEGGDKQLVLVEANAVTDRGKVAGSGGGGGGGNGSYADGYKAAKDKAISAVEGL